MKGLLVPFTILHTYIGTGGITRHPGSEVETGEGKSKVDCFRADHHRPMADWLVVGHRKDSIPGVPPRKTNYFLAAFRTATTEHLRSASRVRMFLSAGRSSH